LEIFSKFEAKIKRFSSFSPKKSQKTGKTHFFPYKKPQKHRKRGKNGTELEILYRK
jgi:hypothetical protein